MPLSRKALELSNLHVPIRCRTVEERTGVERWLALAPQLIGKSAELGEVWRRMQFRKEEMQELANEAMSIPKLAFIGEVMREVHKAGWEEVRAASSTWMVILMATAEAMLKRIRENTHEVKLEGEAYGAEIRPQLEMLRQRWTSSKRAEKIKLAIDTVEILLSYDDGSLGHLEGDFAPDLVDDFFGVPEGEGTSFFINQEWEQRIVQRGEELAKLLPELEKEWRARGAVIRQQEQAFVKEVEAAREVLPGTGETAFMVAMLSDVVRAFRREEEPKDAPKRSSRIIMRMALWLALGDLHWTPDARAALLQLIHTPRQFSRYEPQTETGREIKRRLRHFKSLFFGVRPPDEFKSLVENVNRAETDTEVLWVISEYLTARFEADKTTQDLNDLIVTFFKALSEVYRTDITLLVKFLGNVMIYDGTASLRTKLDVEIERLEAEEKAQAQVPPEFDFTRLRPPARPVQEPAAPAVSPVTLTYVFNPESVVPRAESVTCPPTDAYPTILAMLEQNANLSEPPTSLARAVFHYAFETPEEHWLTWNKEKVGHFVFHKLKRGSARVYIRRQGNEVVFHAYKRKDWSKHQFFAEPKS